MDDSKIPFVALNMNISTLLNLLPYALIGIGLFLTISGLRNISFATYRPKTWQDIILDEWKNCDDEERANKLFYLVAHEPVKKRGIIFLLLWGIFHGTVMGALASLIYQNRKLYFTSNYSNLNLSLLSANQEITFQHALIGAGAGVLIILLIFIFFRKKIRYITWFNWLLPKDSGMYDENQGLFSYGVLLILSLGFVYLVQYFLTIGLIQGLLWIHQHVIHFLTVGIVQIIVGIITLLGCALVIAAYTDEGRHVNYWLSFIYCTANGWLFINSFGFRNFIMYTALPILALLQIYFIGDSLDNIFKAGPFFNRTLYRFRSIIPIMKVQPNPGLVRQTIRNITSKWSLDHSRLISSLSPFSGVISNQVSLETLANALISNNWEDIGNLMSELIPIEKEIIQGLITYGIVTEGQNFGAWWIAGTLALEHKRVVGTKWNSGILLCPDCYARILLYTYSSLTLMNGHEVGYYGCRHCQRSSGFLETSIVTAVLDSNMVIPHNSASGAILVNWLKSRKLFDFNRVEILSADDVSIQSFLVQVGNDTDSTRISNYKTTAVTISPHSTLSENTRRMIKNVFPSSNI